jgi:hypothetical protein
LFLLCVCVGGWVGGQGGNKRMMLFQSIVHLISQLDDKPET